MRVQYTTYDMQRSYDVLSVKRHADIMTLTPDHDPDTGESSGGHPFMYRKILRIFHADITYNKPGQRPTQHRMEFLWVQNYKLDRSHKAGLQHRRFHRVTLAPVTDADTFVFLDPDEVIRAVHLIPAFAHGRTGDAQDATFSQDNKDNWKYFYVNCFVDRDMYTRFTGGGIGHYAAKLQDPALDTDEQAERDREAADGEGENEAAQGSEQAPNSAQVSASMAVDEENNTSEGRDNGATSGSVVGSDDETDRSSSSACSSGSGLDAEDEGDSEWEEDENTRIITAEGFANF
ncbi:hypothetical protein K474DRAFT_1712409 [Panus rudis PR-1116 ss-1]|nr:hypothetical protein K474DRAFT_1712409 [Panus rudis PR-1116 ss-1]